MTTRRQILHAGAATLAATGTRLSFAAPTAAGMDPLQAAAHVLNRLGYGPRPGDLAQVSRDPAAWVARQLQPRSMALPESLTARLSESQLAEGDPVGAVRQLAALLADRRQVAQAQQAAQAIAEQRADRETFENPVVKYVLGWQQPAYESRIFRALESPRQLEEAMVDFWFNHFNVFQGKTFDRVLVGHYEHNAIRPFALGRFRDLLGATAHHPAMLYYLDNWQSVGGGAAQSRGRGLNENYARELMELHTLGVDGGYSQQDVTQLARMLTGWTVVPPRSQGGGFAMVPASERGAMAGFVFNERLHDPGEKVWLGQRIAPGGRAEGEHALDVLAAHPATARNISFKLAQYFVADRPPPALVDRLAKVFVTQDGQITPVLATLFASEEFWSPAQVGSKFKTPYHYVISTLRAGGYGVPNVLPLVRALAAQGMPLYGCATPDGWRNTEAAWLNPDGMSKRIAFATQVAHGRAGNERLAGGLDAAGLVDQLGPLVTPETSAIALQERNDPALSVALVLGGPGMMRR